MPQLRPATAKYINNKKKILMNDETSDICYDMNKPREHDTRWNKPDMKGQIL